LTSVALWTGHRLWRAVALALITWMLLIGLPDRVTELVWALQGKSIGYSHSPLAQMLADHPALMSLGWLEPLLGLLPLVAGLAALLHPTVRAAFGLPPRARLRNPTVAPPLGTTA
jgi:hypothetical protein